MRFYETTFIVNPQADDNAIDKTITAISDIITTHGGKIIHEERMGIRRLAYDIAGLNQGHYASYIFQSGPEVIALLERHFRLEEPFLRHMTITFDGDPMAIKERQDAFVNTLEENEERARRERRERMEEEREFRGGGRGRWGGDRRGHGGPREDRPHHGGGGGGGYRGPRDDRPRDDRPHQSSGPQSAPAPRPQAPAPAPQPEAPTGGGEEL